MQTTGRIEHSRLGLLYSNLQAFIAADQCIKAGDDSTNLYRSSNSSRFTRLTRNFQRLSADPTRSIRTSPRLCRGRIFTRKFQLNATSASILITFIGYACTNTDERRLDNEQYGTTGDTLDHPFLNQQIEVTAGIGTIYLSLHCYIFSAEACMTTQYTTLCWSLCAQGSQ